MCVEACPDMRVEVKGQLVGILSFHQVGHRAWQQASSPTESALIYLDMWKGSCDVQGSQKLSTGEAEIPSQIRWLNLISPGSGGPVFLRSSH